jgi:PKD repeat protein
MHTARRQKAARPRAPERASPSRPRFPLPSIRARLRPSSAGQALVEFALILPVFLLLLVVAVDFGRLFYTYVQIHNAAREGAAVAIYAPTLSAPITSHATGEKNSQGQRGDVENAIVVTSSCHTAAGALLDCSLAQGGTGAGNTVTVNVNQRFIFLTPLISQIVGSSLQLNASATAAVLGYAGGGGGSNPGTCSLPTASFVWTITSGRTVFFNPAASTPNSGVCNISGYNWTWGDGLSDVGTATGLSHTFASDNTWVVKLEVTNQAGPNEQIQNVPITTVPPPPTCAKPTPNFYIFDKTGQGNKTYNYRDSSTVADLVNCPITDWLWTFNDVGGIQSNATNPSQTYASGGNHSVTLRVTNAGGSNTITLNL